MPKRSSKKPTDPNVAAFRIVRLVTADEPQRAEREKNPAAVELGRLGGRKGGKARAAKLTPAERKKIARQAAQARWSRRQD